MSTDSYASLLYTNYHFFEKSFNQNHVFESNKEEYLHVHAVCAEYVLCISDQVLLVAYYEPCILSFAFSTCIFHLQPPLSFMRFCSSIVIQVDSHTLTIFIIYMCIYSMCFDSRVGPSCGLMCWNLGKAKLQLLQDAWTECDGEWSRSELYKKILERRTTSKRGARVWLTRAQICRKYESQEMADAVCDGKLADEESKQQFTKPHPDAPNVEAGCVFYLAGGSRMYTQTFLRRIDQELCDVTLCRTRSHHIVSSYTCITCMHACVYPSMYA